MSGSPSNLPSDAIRDQVQMVLAETLLSTLIPVGSKVGEKAYEYVRSHEPVVVRVLDSALLNDQHEITFLIKNQTEHGAYLESVSVLEPQGACVSKRRGELTGVPVVSPRIRNWLPAHLSPWEDFMFEVKIPKCENRGFDSDWSGKLKLEISRLDQKKPETKEITFRLRWAPR